MTAKKIIGRLHLWLGLSSGLVVFIVALTGCIFAFEEELYDLLHRDLVGTQAPAADAAPLPVSVLLQTAQQALGKRDTVTLINLYPQRNRTWEFDAIRYDREKAASSLWASAGLYWKKVYIDPYTGRVAGIKDMQYEFFRVIRSIHQNLFLKYEIGSPIVGTATLIFVLLLISGLILWWPKNKAAARQRFAFRWKPATKWKRKNYDLHNILGFYMLIFGLFIALTGMVWSFDWWERTVYRALDGKVVPFKLPQNPHPVRVTMESHAVLDGVAAKMSARHADFYRIFLSSNSATNTLTAGVQFKDHSLWTAYDYQVFDLTTGEAFGDLLQENKTTGQKWRNSNYDLHTGKTLGYAGMTLAFCTSLIIASLPVTGCCLWWGRRKKKKPAKKPLT